MADTISTVKATAKKKSRSFLQCGNTSKTPLTTTNSVKLSIISNARLQKVSSKSIEKLSFISEKDDSNDLENYHIEYSTYLLRKAQNRILTKNKEEKEENVKKCFVSLKFELEDLLEKYINLSKEIGYFKLFFEIQKETNKKMENGKKVLNMLKENNFDELLKSLSISLDHTVNQLQLVDIDKQLIDELFSKKIWGLGSEIDESLKKINASISKNKNEVSNIAKELIEIKVLNSENEMLKERFKSVFQQISNDILETNYKLFTDVVKKAFDQREKHKNEIPSMNLDCDTDFLLPGLKPQNSRFSFQLSKLEGSYPVMPNSSSTPQQN